MPSIPASPRWQENFLRKVCNLVYCSFVNTICARLLMIFTATTSHVCSAPRLHLPLWSEYSPLWVVCATHLCFQKMLKKHVFSSRIRPSGQAQGKWWKQRRLLVIKMGDVCVCVCVCVCYLCLCVNC